MWAYVSASCHGLLECSILVSATLDLICTVYIVWVILCGMSTLDTVDKSYHTVMWLTGSMVHPKVVKSVHYCPATTKTIERKYSDLTSLESFPTSAAYPTKVYMSCDISEHYRVVMLHHRMRMEIPWRQNMACPSSRITKPLSYRRCQNEHLLASCLARLRW